MTENSFRPIIEHFRELYQKENNCWKKFKSAVVDSENKNRSEVKASRESSKCIVNQQIKDRV